MWQYGKMLWDLEHPNAIAAAMDVYETLLKDIAARKVNCKCQSEQQKETTTAKKT